MTRTGQLTDGTAVNYRYTYKYDGKEHPVTEAPFDSRSIKRIDANTTGFEIRKIDEKCRFTGQTVSSKDGKALTQTSKGADAAGIPGAGMPRAPSNRVERGGVGGR